MSELLAVKTEPLVRSMRVTGRELAELLGALDDDSPRNEVITWEHSGIIKQNFNQAAAALLGRHKRRFEKDATFELRLFRGGQYFLVCVGAIDDC